MKSTRISMLPTTPRLLALPVGRWPEMLETRALLAEVEKLHGRESDFEEGDLINRLWAFDRYQLQPIALADLDTEEWDWDPDTAREYAARPGPFPPIVYDPKDRTIIDGAHRANAGLQRGDTHIWAYVGQK